MKKLLFVILFLLGLHASAQVQFVSTTGLDIKLSRKNATKKEERTTRVYFTASAIPDTLNEIGLLTVKENDRAVAIEKAKIYGARATGRAVLLLDAADQTAGQAIAKYFIGGKAFKGHYVFLVYRNLNALSENRESTSN